MGIAPTNDCTQLSAYLVQLLEKGLIEEDTARALNLLPTESLQRNLFQEYHHDRKQEIHQRVAEVLEAFARTASIPTPAAPSPDPTSPPLSARQVVMVLVLSALVAGFIVFSIIRRASANVLPSLSGVSTERMDNGRMRLRWQRWGPTYRYNIYSITGNLYNTPRKVTARPIYQADWALDSQGPQKQWFLFVSAVDSKDREVAWSKPVLARRD